ncbi:Sll0314/Alr1548 family TPR repeat-containing protein [Thermosynechococcaceae cyanobacterium BACA0444]|uniref:Sll0314/Alr1548 family TPR repeat-containing protein n=1 Tax=Pseudocalidococcus azoricus BACA0444 TaxID=2918990 RepID=A0AAE4FR45_9CYAN|nr:Sll0314/Alr1548 family TPR repeat-containing protein [Pseudocalidococcus azoricus]MDS3860763.1 Sll0314/Alr1548 family TPR repeat-containing protein [Pseudocalidococcus azoricus BACA0444]
MPSQLSSINPKFRQTAQRALLTCAAIVLTHTSGAWAADPFRTGENSRPISDATSAVFVAVFRDGNYTKGRQLLPAALRASAQEPLTLTMAGGMAFLDGNWADLNRYANQTIQAAQKLSGQDPLRGNLYQAVGNFLLAAHDMSEGGSGPVAGAALALMRAQDVFGYLNQAKAINPNDPELNLIQGFIEWGVANNLGIFKIEDAITRLQTQAAPPYLSYRGVALAYRDLNQSQLALEAIEKAIAAAPNNPELIYLKAQILSQAGNKQASLSLFNQALTMSEQLPGDLVKQMKLERDQVQAALPQ